MMIPILAAALVSATNLVVDASARYAWAGVQEPERTFVVPGSNAQELVRWEFTLGSVRDADPSVDSGVLANVFVTPTPRKFIHGRVYAMVPALVVTVKPECGTYDVSVWLKNAPTSGLGFNCLFEGRFREKPSDDFRIGIDFNRGLYRVRTDREISTVRGAISGRADFSHPDWANPAYAGAYAENDAADRHAVVELSGISSETVRLPSDFGKASARCAVEAKDAPAKPVTVRVDPSCAYEVNGFGEVQNIFNGNVNGDDHGTATHLVRMLNPNGMRAFLQIGGRPGYPRTHGAFRQFGGVKPPEGESYDAAMEKFWKQDFETTVPAAICNSSGAFIGPQASQLGYFREIGLKDGIVFLPAPLDGTALAHPEETKRYYSAYIAAIRKTAPWIGEFWLQYVNEPNYPWFTDDFGDDQRKASAACLDLYNLIDAHLRANHPGVKLIGPCLAANTFPFFYDWVRPFLSRVCQPIDIWNYHSYDQPQWAHLAWMGLYQAEAARIGRPRPQGYCTEMAYALGKKDLDGDRMVWEAQQLMTALENPDKWKGLSWHLLVMDWFNSSNVIRKDWLGEKNDRIECYAGSLWYLFYAFNRVRGPLVAADAGGDGQVREVAVRYDPTLISVVLLNDGPARRHVALDVGGVTAPDRVYRLRRTAANAVSTSFSQYADGNAFDLEPGELLSLQYRGPFGAPARTRRRREWYGETCGRYFEGRIGTRIRMPEVSPESTCVLRFALGMTDPLFSRRGKVSFNGRSFEVNWADHRRGYLHDDDGVLLFDLPIKASELKTENEFELEVDDAAYHFMFASVVVTQE